jgi:hypothetical protein
VGNALPADKPVNILLLRPDIEVGEMQASGLVEPNADWTEAARKMIRTSIEKHLQSRQAAMQAFDAPSPEMAQVVADYESLHRAVAGSIIQHKIYGVKLPTKKDKFDWTLGPGTQTLAEATNTTYGLFLFGRDSFASAGRRGVQAVGMLGCLVSVCLVAAGGQHMYYASLVDLSSGNVVWFNFLNGFKGDVRKDEGVDSMVSALFASMPTQAGVVVPKKTAAKSR